jgi:hypothetical protein
MRSGRLKCGHFVHGDAAEAVMAKFLWWIATFLC